METIDTIHFDASFHGTGWHEAESYMIEDGPIYYRWMSSGGECSVSMLSSPSSDCIAKCDIMSVVEDSVLDHLEVEVDGQPTTWRAESRSGGDIVIAFLLPVKPDLSPHDVVFSVTKEFKANESDQRNLSLAFRGINVEKASFLSVMEFLEVEY